MNEPPRLSVIIPCRADEKALSSLLPIITVSERIEVIVVSDGTNASAVQDVCAEYGARCIVMAGSRGLRLREGAKQANAANLWFLHADSVPVENAVEAVIASLGSGWVGGYFRFRLTGRRILRKLLIEWSVAMRCRLGGIPYGDQAIFVSVTAYKEAGEHAPLPLFEEASLVRHLQRSGHFRPLSLPVGVDPRRWDEDGYVIKTLKNRVIALAYVFGASPDRLAQWYFGGR